MISSTVKNISFAKKDIIKSIQTASVLTTAGWSDSANGFSITIPTSGKYKLTAEFSCYADGISSDGYWCIGIDGVNVASTIRRTVAGAIGGAVMIPTHIEVIADCTAGQVITLRNNEVSGDVRADWGSGGVAPGYIQAEMIEAYVPNIMMTAWQAYALTIGAVTTPPTKGTIARDVASWRKVGANMEIMYTFRQSTTGTNGTGIYLFPIPAGYTIDTALTGIVQAPSYNAEASVGYGDAFDGSNTYHSIMHVYDTGNLTMTLGNPASVVSSASALALGAAATIVYSYKASVPIVGFS